MASNLTDSDSVIGEECHIVARELDGPRGNSSLPVNDRDNVDNLLLLCRNHHKMIDDQLNTFTVDDLKAIKSKHEDWVRESLSPSRKANPKIFLPFELVEAFSYGAQ